MQVKLGLEREQYNVLETVKGVLILSTEKGCSIRDIRFAATGSEITRITVRRGSMDDRSTKTYSESNMFFVQNLLQFWSSAGAIRPSKDGITIDPGRYQIPSSPVLPENVPQSYNGRYATIEYKIGVVVDRQNKWDVRKEVTFAVINHTKGSNMSSSGDIAETFLPFGKSVDAALEFDQQTIYTSGQRIEGRVVILKDLRGKKVNGVEIMLRQIEYAKAQERKSSEIMTEWKQKVEATNDDKRIPFQFIVPADVQPTYIGKISKIIWVLEGKINLSWSKDIHLATIIAKA